MVARIAFLLAFAAMLLAAGGAGTFLVGLAAIHRAAVRILVLATAFMPLAMVGALMLSAMFGVGGLGLLRIGGGGQGDDECCGCDQDLHADLPTRRM
ncbi:MAG: hypothetical protein AVDCRST_MAG23-491 [uncultured Sphingosinicella sp.]|uniref:Uncharacterized protein n=1 Tax=uncultured Sphingosinicella sp. TaxID=478748 RepID=A0A6J4TIP7_9SPHN|nr:MAG: hypothetical protein AVDCRST_MAG23-491 [uncultured Sphingosinicella sp.]